MRAGKLALMTPVMTSTDGRCVARISELYLSDLRGADLSAVKGLVSDQLENTCGDAGTRLPAGVTPPADWPCTRAEEEEE